MIRLKDLSRSPGGMVRRFLTVVLVLLIAMPVAASRKRHNYAGSILKDTYTDLEFGFSVEIPFLWSHERGEKGELCHLHLYEDTEMRKSYSRAMGFDIRGRILEFWVVTSIPTAIECLDSMVSDSSRSNLRKAFKKRLHLSLENTGTPVVEEYDRKDTTVAGRPALLWRAKRTGAFHITQKEYPIESVLQVLTIECGEYLLVCLSRHPKGDDLNERVIARTWRSISFTDLRAEPDEQE